VGGDVDEQLFQRELKGEGAVRRKSVVVPEALKPGGEPGQLRRNAADGP
jgi:hypothetical protein